MMDGRNYTVLLTDAQQIKVLECDPQEELGKIARDAIGRDCNWLGAIRPDALASYDYQLLVDEEAKYRGIHMPINTVASDLNGVDRYNDPIMGNAIVVKASEDRLILLTKDEAEELAAVLEVKRDLSLEQISKGLGFLHSASHRNDRPASLEQADGSDAAAQDVEAESTTKVVIPCDVEIKRYYRTYVTVDEGSTKEQIIQAMREEILENQDNALTPDPDMGIEEDDITLVFPDFDAMWTEEGKEIKEILDNPQADTKPIKKKDNHYER